MYTDPDHIKVSDPGKVEGNTVFAYLDIFDPNKNEVKELKAHYRAGGLGDVVLKKRLIQILNDFLEPIRQKRKEFEKDPDYVMNVLFDGTKKTLAVAQSTMQEIRNAMHLNYETLLKK